VRVTIDVRRVAVADIFPLRHAVLRPGRPESASVYPEDGYAVHVAAYHCGDGAEVLAGCATVFPEAWPGASVGPGWVRAPQPAAWRLRGMAVDPARHGCGVGRLVLAAVVDAAAGAGAPLLWANGRTTALGFYERLGWSVVGEEFIAADSGLPHKPIALPVDCDAKCL